MEREQEENQKQLKELTLSLRRSNEQESDVRTFIREIRQYATIQEKEAGSRFSGFQNKLGFI